MDPTEIINKYRRFLKRINYSKITVRNYFFNIKQFSDWLKVPIDEVTSEIIFEYIGFLHNRRRDCRKSPKMVILAIPHVMKSITCKH